MQLYVDARYTSPYAMSVFCALHEKHLSFDLVGIDLEFGENKTEMYQELTPMERVPIFVCDEGVISESSAIEEYLEERFSAVPLYPSGRFLRAKAREMQAWIRSDLLALRKERPTTVMFCGEKKSPLSLEAQACVDRLFRVCTPLFSGKPFFFESWSIVDVDLACVLNRLVAHGDPVPDVLQAYVQAQWQRSSIQKWCILERPFF